jgi:hypothetical protein
VSASAWFPFVHAQQGSSDLSLELTNEERRSEIVAHPGRPDWPTRNVCPYSTAPPAEAACALENRDDEKRKAEHEGNDAQHRQPAERHQLVRGTSRWLEVIAQKEDTRRDPDDTGNAGRNEFRVRWIGLGPVCRRSPAVWPDPSRHQSAYVEKAHGGFQEAEEIAATAMMTMEPHRNEADVRLKNPSEKCPSSRLPAMAPARE